MSRVTRALVSVSDKTGIVDFAAALHELGVEIISTGGTAKRLGDSGVPVIEVSEHTGFPELMDGRVKTLHPKIHGGLLARRDADADAMREHRIDAIDLLVVNLYPFEQTIARPGCDLDSAIDNIDIGGPTMLRAAAKNLAWVTVVVDAEDYGGVSQSFAPARGRTRDTVPSRHQGVRAHGALRRHDRELLGARDGSDALPVCFPAR